MQAAQTMGIGLPLKVLVWQNAESKTWIAYNDLTMIRYAWQNATVSKRPVRLPL
jgi:uncharacterized protein (DUF302 family)